MLSRERIQAPSQEPLTKTAHPRDVLYDGEQDGVSPEEAVRKRFRMYLWKHEKELNDCSLFWIFTVTMEGNITEIYPTESCDSADEAIFIAGRLNREFGLRRTKQDLPTSYYAYNVETGVRLFYPIPLYPILRSRSARAKV